MAGQTKKKSSKNGENFKFIELCYFWNEIKKEEEEFQRNKNVSVLDSLMKMVNSELGRKQQNVLNVVPPLTMNHPQSFQRQILNSPKSSFHTPVKSLDEVQANSSPSNGPSSVGGKGYWLDKWVKFKLTKPSLLHAFRLLFPFFFVVVTTKADLDSWSGGCCDRISHGI